ncbi:hypothetical protein SLEP1_g30015 [Rubroshorea leprosula]|uniref:Uncharacterized protein n=1 Tax=Rubroshorea leprosula TaxID=152421 RepID=A0AAV5K179_9ROSI|nr:hypothetical protein SLEP1_g30015 [Rubroshorea leprosula]
MWKTRHISILLIQRGFSSINLRKNWLKRDGDGQQQTSHTGHPRKKVGDEIEENLYHRDRH